MQAKFLSRTAALVMVVVAPVLLGLGLYAYQRWAPGVRMLELEVAGSAKKAANLAGGHKHDFIRALQIDFILIAAYLGALLIACYLGIRVFWQRSARAAARVAFGAAIAGAACDLAENGLLLAALRHPPLLTGDWAYRSVQAVAFTKFVLLAIAATIAIVAWVVTAGRLISSLVPARDLSWPVTEDEAIPPGPADLPPGGSAAEGAPPAETPPPERIAEDAHWRYGGKHPPGRSPADVGICVSGGGVRSACVTLGALQALREQGELGRAGYLVSVSGGGYAVGAMLQALQLPHRNEDADRERPAYAPTPADVFAPGSVEEDYVRRHSSYIADGARQWLGALGALARSLLASMAFTGLITVVAGIGIGLFYQHVPVIGLTALRASFAASSAPSFPVIPAGVILAMLAVSGCAGLLYLGSLIYMIFKPSGPDVPWPGALLAALKAASAAAGVLLVAGLVIPSVMWASVWLSSWRPSLPGGPSAAGAGLGTVLIAYAGTLAAVVWRNRKALASQVAAARGRLGRGSTGQALPTSLLQRLIVYAALIILVAALLLLFGLVAVNTADWPAWALITPPVVLLASGAILDQTWLSLHPFYRRRLASAFAVRRGQATARAGARAGVAAQPYSFDEPTPLTEYARTGSEPGSGDAAPSGGSPGPAIAGNGAAAAGGHFPKVIFAASANLSGQDRTPPGRRAVPFTFASDYIGGPDVGWVSTKWLLGHHRMSPQLQGDLTVQAAVAISGAAFASAMGSQARPYQTFLALTNARLGSWLANPRYLVARAQRAADGDWTMPRLPRLRRLTYLLREIFGVFPSDGQMLLCTDGGHYDNLGLIELLRHRCKLIYCIDASGDNPPLAQTLAGAITLARDELGVEISLDDPLALVPGSAQQLRPEHPLRDLNGRLSRAAVCTGTITYPTATKFPGGHPTCTGRLVLAKASLTPDMPYELLAYAARNAAFPRDSTSDQWFDHGQFNAYSRLGRIVGRHAARASSLPQPSRLQAADGGGAAAEVLKH